MKNTSLKLLVLALVGLFLTNCQRDDAPEVLPQEEPVPAVDPQAVVSLDEAKSLFEASENQKRTTNSVSRSNYPLIELETDWRYFLQTQTLIGDAYAKIPITIIGADLSAEMLFLKENGITEQYLFITEPDSLTNDNRIVNADFYLLTPKGEFISAYRMTDGVISHQLVPKVKANYRLVVDTDVTPTGRKRPKKTKGTPASIKVEGKTEDPGESDRESGNGGGVGGGLASGGGGDAPIQLEPVSVYGTRPVHYSSYPTYNGNDYGNFTKGKDPKPSENGAGSGSGGGSSSSAVGVTIVKGKKKLKTIDDEEKEKKEEKKQDKREDTIKDSLTNRCAKALLAQAPNLNNDIAKILRETFGTNNKFNLTILEDNKLRGSSTDAYYHLISMSKEKGEVEIYFNPDILNSATNEYILVTMYHEAIHAFLSYEKKQLGDKFNEKYPSVYYYRAIGIHNGVAYDRFQFLRDQKGGHFQFEPFIDKLVDAIRSYNHNIPLDTAKAMAKTGIVREMFDWEIRLNQNEREGNNNKKGTKCTP